MSADPRLAAPDLLSAIVAAAQRIVESRAAREPIEAVARRGASRQPRGQAFRDALARPGTINVIAECKRRSPSRGVLRSSYDPSDLARQYARGGAAAVSVLTEPTFFDGSLDDLQAVRDAVDLPVLRKDFIVAEYQVHEARAVGADAVLLIAAALAPSRLRQLLACAAGQGLAALVEVHDERELGEALDAGAALVGVNSRNLRTLEVDTRICEALARRVPPGVVAVAESGLRTAEAVRRMRDAGYAAFLIGEWLVTHADPVSALRSLGTLVGRPAGDES